MNQTYSIAATVQLLASTITNNINGLALLKTDSYFSEVVYKSTSTNSQMLDDTFKVSSYFCIIINAVLLLSTFEYRKFIAKKMQILLCATAICPRFMYSTTSFKRLL